MFILALLQNKYFEKREYGLLLNFELLANPNETPN